MLDILEPYTAEQFLYWRAAEQLKSAHEAYAALPWPRPHSYAPWFDDAWLNLRRRARERDAVRAELGKRRRLIETWHEELRLYGD